MNELTLKNGSVLWDENLLSFTNEFTYLLNGKYTRMAGYASIPDDVINTASNGMIDILFIADGTEIYTLGWLSAESEKGNELMTHYWTNQTV